MSTPKIRTVDQLAEALRDGGRVSQCRSTGRINLGHPDLDRSRPTIYGLVWRGFRLSEFEVGRTAQLPSEHGDWVTWEIAAERPSARTHDGPG